MLNAWGGGEGRYRVAFQLVSYILRSDKFTHARTHTPELIIAYEAGRWTNVCVYSGELMVIW